jgi:nucleoid-associated protein EbfC
MKGNIGNMMRQAQQMQENLQRAQQEIAALEVTGSAGGGLVTVTMTGKHEVRRVVLDPGLMDEEHAMIEDLVAAAVNDAVQQVEAEVSQRMGSVTEGMPLPPGLKLF